MKDFYRVAERIRGFRRNIRPVEQEDELYWAGRIIGRVRWIEELRVRA